MLGVASAAAAGETLYDLWMQYQRSKEPAGRKAAVAKIAEDGSDGAARHLASVAKDDPALDVRLAAVEGLGRSPSKEALDLLVGVLCEGGVRPARLAAAAAVARRDGGVERLAAEVTSREIAPDRRDLVLAALGDCRSATARDRLCRFAVSEVQAVRVGALRALATQKEGREILGPLLPDVLAMYPDVETTLCALDLGEEHGARDLRRAATDLLRHADAEVRSSAESVLLRLDWLDAVARKKPVRPDDPYAPGETDDLLPPPPRARVDAVYAFDATGSIAGYEKWLAGRIVSDIEVLRRSGASVRVGIVAFRDRVRDANSVRTEVLPLTHDATRVAEFLDEIRARGVDTRGTDAGLALATAMDRMAWRWNARRSTVLVLDTKVGDPERAHRIANLHAADRTKLDVLYLRRTRGDIPPSVHDLAKLVGTTVRVVDDVPDLPGR